MTEQLGYHEAFLSYLNIGAILPDLVVKESSGLSKERRPDLGTAQISDTSTLHNPQYCLESFPLQSDSVQQIFLNAWGNGKTDQTGPLPRSNLASEGIRLVNQYYSEHKGSD